MIKDRAIIWSILIAYMTLTGFCFFLSDKVNHAYDRMHLLEQQYKDFRNQTEIDRDDFNSQFISLQRQMLQLEEQERQRGRPSWL